VDALLDALRERGTLVAAEVGQLVDEPVGRILVR
jgi:hypothetical protein